jgi:hypothetical protein
MLTEDETSRFEEIEEIVAVNEIFVNKHFYQRQLSFS